MDTVYTGTVCLSKLDRERIVHSEKTGQDWFQIGIVILEKPDRFGNEIIIQHRGTKGRKHIIIGNAVCKGKIEFKFPNGQHMPSKMETRCEREETYRDYNLDDLT